MQPDTSIRNADVRTIAVLVAILAGVVAAIGLVVTDPSIDTSHVDRIPTSQLSMVSATRSAAEATGPISKAAEKVTPEENWSADESSRGIRPDAAH